MPRALAAARRGQARRRRTTIDCTTNLLPDLLPMARSLGAGGCGAGWAGLVVAAALFLWRGVPALIGRSWRAHPDPMHLPPGGQRIADGVLSLGLLVAALGLVERDWGWQAIGFGAVVSWVLASMVFGLVREREPDVPRTTPTVLGIGVPDNAAAPPPDAPDAH
jgi:hypothetical protein